MSVPPVLAAGGTFAGAALAGLAIGMLVTRATGNMIWVPVALFAGLAIGAYGAVRLLMRS